MLARVRALGRDRRGITMIEYAAMAGLIAAALILAVPMLTSAVQTTYGEIGTELSNAGSSGSSGSSSS